MRQNFLRHSSGPDIDATGCQIDSHQAVPSPSVAIIRTMKASRSPLAFLALSICIFVSQSTVAQTKPAAASAPAATVQVPFVGCASDGQVGPLKAPTGTDKAIAISPASAQRLAYYKAKNSVGVLAPRGWNCFSTYGSNGSNLFVSPDPIDSNAFFSSDWKGFSGPIIEISGVSGGTSGRFQVAQVIARVFPAYKAFAQSVIGEGVEPASSFPSGPYPADKLTYRSKSTLEFETPANTEGLGTTADIQAASTQIDGVAVISGPDTDLVLLSARVPPVDRDLIQIIVGQVELEAATP